MANIQITVTSDGTQIGSITTGTSRDDLLPGAVITAYSTTSATTYAWSLLAAPTSPDGAPSTATLTAPTERTCQFTVDWDGAYLISLVCDSGMPTETTQYLRLRAPTAFGQAMLPAPGERKDSTGTVPADAAPEGWALALNGTLARAMVLARRQAVSGRVLYLDPNQGRDYTAASNNSSALQIPGDRSGTGLTVKAYGHGDFARISDALAYIALAESRGEPPVSETQPYLLILNPGVYGETLNLPGGVHLLGQMGTVIRSTEQHVVNSASTIPTIIRNVTLDCPTFTASASTNLTLDHVVLTGNFIQGGTGALLIKDCDFDGNVTAASAGSSRLQGSTFAVLSVTGPSHSTVVQDCWAESARIFCLDAHVDGLTLRDPLTIKPASPMMQSHNVTLNLHRVVITGVSSEGYLNIDQTRTTGSLTLSLGSISTASGPLLDYTSLPGQGPQALVDARGLKIDPAYAPPETGTQVNVTTLPATDVARAIAYLTRLILTQGYAPYTGLQGVYDGFSALDPPTPGQGLGREITARDGAVQIKTGSTPEMVDPLLRGGLQLEGCLDIGPTQYNGLGSEIFLSPAPMGLGPICQLGRSYRGPQNVASVCAGYDLHVSAIQGAARVQGDHVTLEAKQNVQLAPEGLIRVTKGSESTFSTLTFSTFTPVDGTMYLQTMYGLEEVQIYSSDTLGSFVLRVGYMAKGFTAHEVEDDHVVLKAKLRGPGAVLTYVGGATVGGYPTFTPGVSGPYVDMECTATGTLKVYGALVSDNGGSASATAYDNTSSGLTATEVQSALDEVVGRLAVLEGTPSMVGALASVWTSSYDSNSINGGSLTLDA